MNKFLGKSKYSIGRGGYSSVHVLYNVHKPPSYVSGFFERVLLTNRFVLFYRLS